MSWPGETWRKLALLVHRRREDADLDEEMRFHLEMRAAEQATSGMDAREADYAARRRFGSLALLREEARDAWQWPLVESTLRDLRLALRTLRASPAFVAVALLSLGLGIGANVAIFSFVSTLFLSPIPGVVNSRQLISVHYREGGGAGSFTSSTYPDFEYVRMRNRTFTDMLAYVTTSMTVHTGGRTDNVTVEIVSPNYFELLGVTPVVGRAFGPAATASGEGQGAVLDYDFWRQRLGGDTSILGKAVRVGEGMFTVVAVAPHGFHGLSLEWEQPPAIWLPASAAAAAGRRDLNSWGNRSFEVVGRLRAGATAADAMADVTALAFSVRADHPEWAARWRDLPGADDLRPVLVPAMRSRVSPDARDQVLEFLALLGATALAVFLLACFNVAGLVLARALKRRQQIALQLALGAGRARLIRQLLTENLVLSLLGAAGGLLVARWATSVFSLFGQAFAVTLSVDASLDARVLGFAAAVAAVCAVILTVLPARVASSASLTAVMKGDAEGGRATRAVRVQHALLTAQIAVSVVLLVGANLFVKTLHNARAMDPTDRPQDVMAAEVNLAEAKIDPVRGALFYSQLIDRLRGVPGVRGGAFVFIAPLGGRRGGTDILPDATGSSPVERPTQVGFNVVTPGYFAMIGLPLVAGRSLRDGDRSGAPPVAVVNEVLAQRLFPGRSPLGQHLLVQWRPQTLVEVVGVVRDGRFRTVKAAMEPTVYVPLAQRYMPQMTLEVRTTGAVSRVMPAVEREVTALAKDVALTRVRTLAAHRDATLSQERLLALLLTCFAVLALLLAMVGLYGSLSYAFAQRTREIGIRIALGARPGAMVRLVLGRVLILMIVGLCIGAVAAFAGAQFVRSLLFDVAPSDPGSYLVTVAALLVTAALAALLPITRAATADPIAALRCE